MAVIALTAAGLVVYGVTRGDGAKGAGPPATTAAAVTPSEGAPVVEVVFDELPTATLMNASGTRIDRRRFPGFANLAAHSTWYRNNTTVADFTGRAVPAIETGIDPPFDVLPVASQQPNSIFSLLGGKYRFNVHEPVTDVCPQSLCPGQSAAAPSKGVSAGQFAQDLFVPPKRGEFEHWLAKIRSGDRSFNFIHMEVPHEPFHFLPDGRSYEFTPISDVGNSNAQRWAGGAGGTATTWQRHYIQTGYADRLLSKLIARLKKVGIWQRALVIVTADHGISFDPKTFRRIAVANDFGGIANPPLFIKYPGQTAGEVSDIHTHSIDIVPTTAEALGLKLPYKAEGVPISDDAEGGPITISNGTKHNVTVSFDQFLAERRAVLASAARQLGAKTGLFALGPQSNLLGRRAPGGSARGAAVDPNLAIGDYKPRPGAKIPAFVEGTIGAGAAGKVVAIAVNGRIAATCRAFRFGGRTRWGAVVPPGRIHAGANKVGVYLVRGGHLSRGA